MKEIPVKTSRKEEFLDITHDVQGVISDSNVKEGMCVVFCKHTTAGLTINENADPDVKRDIIKALSIFNRDDYEHGEGNSSAHVKSSLMGVSAMIPISEGKLVLGSWQEINFCEFDGPRSRKVLVNVLSKQ